MTSELRSPARKAVLYQLLKEGESSAAGLANSIGISVQAMRRHLRNLEDEELVESVAFSLGPGRPSNLWHLSRQGRQSFNNEQGSEKFAIEVLSSIESKFSSQMLSDILGQQVLEKANAYRKRIGTGELSQRLQRLVDLRVHEGHLTEFHPAKSKNGLSSSWYLNALHCSIQSIAESFPIVCDQELALIRYIFPDCDVKRVQWRIENGHSCGFEITPH